MPQLKMDRCIRSLERPRPATPLSLRNMLHKSLSLSFSLCVYVRNTSGTDFNNSHPENVTSTPESNTHQCLKTLGFEGCHKPTGPKDRSNKSRAIARLIQELLHRLMKWEFSAASRKRKLSPGSRTGRAIDDLVTMLLGARDIYKVGSRDQETQGRHCNM
jgi:hypothetical protein